MAVLHLPQATRRRPVHPVAHPAPSQDQPPLEYVIPQGLNREIFRAMGTSVMLLLPERQATSSAAAVRSLFAEWEHCLSRFMPESELSHLNQHAGEPMRVSALLYIVLTQALAAAEATHGFYDPTLQRQIVALGYDRTFEQLAKGTTIQPMQAATPGGGWRDIYIDRSTRQVTLPAGVGLDFGGIAKGMAVDAAIALLRRMGIQTALVNAGGDLAVLGQPPDREVWPIAVFGKNEGWTVPFQRGAMATSGIAKRHWLQGKRLQHHLLDPRTGLPSQSTLWSVTVTADRCEQAEVAAKVAYLLGPARGATFLQDHRFAALLVLADGTWMTVDPWPNDAMNKSAAHQEVLVGQTFLSA